jgi:hypothetical protein
MEKDIDLAGFLLAFAGFTPHPVFLLCLYL